MYDSGASADVLSFTIELPDGKYASINNRSRGFRDPRKSPVYNAVYAAVKMHAEDEIDRVRWEKGECECATIIRFVNRRMRVDPGNLSKVELDAMTEAGVWTDDRLASAVAELPHFGNFGLSRTLYAYPAIRIFRAFCQFIKLRLIYDSRVERVVQFDGDNRYAVRGQACLAGHSEGTSSEELFRTILGLHADYRSCLAISG